MKKEKKMRETNIEASLYFTWMLIGLTFLGIESEFIAWLLMLSGFGMIILTGIASRKSIQAK